jgi:hypothetical protein
MATNAFKRKSKKLPKSGVIFEPRKLEKKHWFRLTI